MVDKEVLDDVKKTIDEAKAGLDKADTALSLLEAMEIDTKEMRKAYEGVKAKLSKMEEAHTKVSAKE